MNMNAALGLVLSLQSLAKLIHDTKTYHISKWYNIFSCSWFSSPKICIGRSALFTVKVTCNHFKAIAIVHFSNLVSVQFLELVQLVQLVQLVHVLETEVPFTGYEARNNFQILRYTTVSIFVPWKFWRPYILSGVYDRLNICAICMILNRRERMWGLNKCIYC